MSIKHRAIIDPKEERLSVTAFHSPNVHATIDPLKELTMHDDGEDVAYKTLDHDNLMKLFLVTKLEGKSFLHRMKLK